MQNEKCKMGGSRVGIGYDVHRLVAGRRLILGGVEIPSKLGLDGHSDADVLLHAIMDALLGAAGLHDIGHHFPNTDARWKDASSLVLLAAVRELIAEKNWCVENIDSTLIAESPKIGPYLDRMRERIAAVLQIAPDAVGIKATTHETLGALGRGEGMAAMAVALVSAVRGRQSPVAGNSNSDTSIDD